MAKFVRLVSKRGKSVIVNMEMVEKVVKNDEDGEVEIFGLPLEDTQLTCVLSGEIAENFWAWIQRQTVATFDGVVATASMGGSL